jgi:hypothetical protein
MPGVMRPNMVETMIKKRFLVFVTCSSFSLILSACRDSGTVLRQELFRTISQGEGTVFKMQDFTSFEWDRMYIFQPYASGSEINRRLGFRWAKDDATVVHSDTYRLLVFVKDREVVAHLDYQVWYGTFDGDGDRGLSAEEAVFRVEEAGDWEGPKLYGVRRVERAGGPHNNSLNRTRNKHVFYQSESQRAG